VGIHLRQQAGQDGLGMNWRRSIRMLHRFRLRVAAVPEQIHQDAMRVKAAAGSSSQRTSRMSPAEILT